MEDREKYYLELLNKCNERVGDLHTLNEAYINTSYYDGPLYALILAMHTLEKEIREEIALNRLSIT